MKLNFRGVAILLPCVCCATFAQQAVATMPVSDAKVSGSVEISGKQIRLASGSTVEAGETDAELALSRGGSLKICRNSAVHLAAGADAGEMMFSLDRGAMELRGTIGKFSDVVLTPDLRVLLSGPGEADIKMHTNAQGDTCIDNGAPKDSADDAPYVTVTEQLGTGVYRVQQGQRVMLEHGSVSAVVDNEKEPCGCPPAAPPATTATDFPIAQSEGLAPAPPMTQPAVPPGEVHAQATIPFVFDAAHPPAPESAPVVPQPVTSVPQPVAQTSATPASEQHAPDLISAIQHLYHRIFGRKKSQGTAQ